MLDGPLIRPAGIGQLDLVDHRLQLGCAEEVAKQPGIDADLGDRLHRHVLADQGTTDIDGGVGLCIAPQLTVYRQRFDTHIAGLVGLRVTGIQHGTGFDIDLGGTVRGTEIRLALATDRRRQLISVLNRTAIGINRAEAQIAVCLQGDIAGCFLGASQGAGIDLAGGFDGQLRCVDLHAATAAIGHQRTQLPGDSNVVLADDQNAAVLAHGRRGVDQAVGIHGRLEYLGTGVDLGASANHRAGGEQIDRTGTVDLALNADFAVAGVVLAGHQIGCQRRAFGIAAIGHGRSQLAHLRGAGGGDGQAADVDHAGGTDHKTMGVGEDDVAADLAILQAVQGPVNHRARVVHQVDQIGLACGHVQIDGIAGVDVKVAEGVEASIATHRAGGDVSHRAVGHHAGGGGHSRMQGDVISAGVRCRPGRDPTDRHEQRCSDSIRTKGLKGVNLFQGLDHCIRASVYRHIKAPSLSLRNGIHKVNTAARHK